MLTDKFETLIDTPEAVEELRKLILDLAMRGKLVPQDPNDEPASVLLERIREEKQRLVKEKKIRKQKELPPIKEEEIPYEVPEGWEWVRLGEVGDWGAGATPNRSNPQYYNGTVHWIKTGELNDGYVLDSKEKITELALKECSLRVNKPGTVLIAMYGATIGKVGILEIEATTNQACCACSPFLISNKYLFYFLKASRSELIRLGMGGAQPNISKQKIISFLFPLPPLNEQKRIVAKVDQLMAFCDRLKETIIRRQKQADRLNESAFIHLQQARTREELQTHLKFILDNFNTLCTRKEDVQLLRQTILSLAVQGKLVPQDPNDEPASVLLERIREEKQRLVKEKKIKKQKPLPPIKEEEIPYKVPEGWEWVRIGSLFIISGGKTPSKSNPVYWKDGDIFWVSPKDVKSPELKNSINKITNIAYKDCSLSLLSEGTMIMVVRSGILKRTIPCSITKVKCTINQDIKAFDSTQPVVNQFFMWYIKAFERELLVKYSKKGTTVDRLIFDKFIHHIFPLPPLNEQKRIISKVDQLMSLCDQLEEQLEQSGKAAKQLLQSVMKQLF